MGCRCSNLKEETKQQERFVRRNFNSFNRELKAKYDRPQIESKLRQMYHGTDTIKKNTYISDDNWRIVKRNLRNYYKNLLHSSTKSQY